MKKVHPIDELIAQGEHQQLDFKFEVSDSKKIARTLSAFANTDGGRLLIGVKDNGSVSGIRSEEEYYMIEAAAGLYCRPQVTFTATRWDIRGKTVLEIYVAPSAGKPHLAPDKDDRFAAYIRVADENILANDILTAAWRKKKQPDGTLLKISKPVEKLLHYLDIHPFINLSTFCRLTHISFPTGKHILSDLLAAGALEYKIENKRIVYAAASDKPADEPCRQMP